MANQRIASLNQACFGGMGFTESNYCLSLVIAAGVRYGATVERHGIFQTLKFEGPGSIAFFAVGNLV